MKAKVFQFGKDMYWYLCVWLKHCSEWGRYTAAKNSKMIMIQHYFEIKGIMSKAAEIQRCAPVTTRD